MICGFRMALSIRALILWIGKESWLLENRLALRLLWKVGAKGLLFMAGCLPISDRFW